MGKLYTALGLMSGTSMDGVDASIIKSDGERVYSPILDRYFEYGDKIRQKILDIRAKILVPDHLIKHESEIKDIEREITLFHSNAVKEILNNNKIDVDLLGFHGQTIYHDSKERISKQLGDGKLLSQLTKKKVVYNFRQNDLKNGGQGAPLTPIFHNLIANKYLKEELNKSYSINVINIGGISNITQTVKWDELGKKKNYIKACDVAPGNCLIDEWVRKKSKKRYDIDGSLAGIGKTDELILNQALDNFDNRPDKNRLSFDTKDFDINFLRGVSFEDGAATLTDLSGTIIASGLFSLLSNKIDKSCKVLVSGGGRKNKSLVQNINSRISKNLVIETIDDFGVDGDYVESQAFAFLAIRSFLKLPISFPDTTGCKSPTTGGEVVKNF